MKKKVLNYVLIISLLFSMLGNVFIVNADNGGNPASTLPTPLAEYLFSGNMDDTSGNGHHGTSEDEPELTADRAGNLESAYHFSEGQYIDLGDHEGFGEGSFTVSLWFKMDEDMASGIKQLIGKANGIYSLLSGQYGYIIGLRNSISDPKTSALFHVRQEEPYYGTTQDQYKDKLDGWNMLTLVKNAESRYIRFYLNDGIDPYRFGMGTGENIVDVSAPGCSTRVGCNINGGHAFNGAIDDIRIYDVALTDVQVAELYEMEITAGPSEPVVDKTELNEAIVAAEALEEEDYTVESWQVLQAVLIVAKAVAANEEATQEDVDTALANLQEAIAYMAVVADHKTITWDIVKLNNMSLDNVTGKLNLFKQGLKGSAIEWNAVPTGIIDTDTGRVTRYDEDKEVTLTAIVSDPRKQTQQTQENVFQLTIKAKTPVAGRDFIVATVGNGEVKLNDSIDLNNNYTQSYPMDFNFKIEATPGEGHFFDYWARGDTNSIISTEPTYTGTLGAGINIKAVFNKLPEEEDQSFTVTFRDKSGRILKSGTVNKGENAVPPTTPSFAGYNFIGWSADIGNVIAPITVSALYKRLDDTYKITVVGGRLDTGEDVGNYQFDMPVTVVAAVSEEGKKFDHWEMDGMKVSTKAQFSFFASMKEETVLEAIFLDEDEPIYHLPAITLLEEVMMDKENKRMVFTAIKDVPEDFYLVEHGMILLQSDTEPGNFTLDSPNVVRARMNIVGNDLFRVRKINVRAGEIWYAKAYLIYQDDNGELETVYSEAKFGTMDTEGD